MLNLLRLYRRRRKTRGAVIVEMALCLPFLFVMLGGLIQYAILLHMMATVDEYAWVGARYAAEYGNNIDFNVQNTGSSNSFYSYMAGVATSLNIPIANVTSYWVYDMNPNLSGGAAGTAFTNNTCTSDCVVPNPGDLIQVRITYNMSKQLIFYGLVPGVPQTWSYTAHCTVVSE